MLMCLVCWIYWQCENGHTACSSCCTKLRNKCASCSLPIGYNRCRAIEKVLESIKISCRNIKYGCKETISLSKKHEHEQSCTHLPCLCPIPGCGFVSSSKRLYQHFNSLHPCVSLHFNYETSFEVAVDSDTEYVILQEEVDSTLFILNYGFSGIGNVANVTCIAPTSLTKGFSYELEASRGDSSVKLKSFAESMPKWSPHLPRKAFLLIPYNLGSGSTQQVSICIQRNKSIPDRTWTTWYFMFLNL